MSAELDEAAPPHRAWGVVAATLGATLLAVLNGAAVAAAIGLGVGLLGGARPGSRELERAIREVVDLELVQVVAGVLGSASALFVVAVALVAGPRERIPPRLGLLPFRRRDAGLTVVGMLALTTALASSIELVGLGQGGSIARLEALFTSMTPLERLRVVPVIGLAAGLSEELFFRGYALSKLRQVGGWGAAVAVTALLFGFIHFDPVHSTAAAAMGLFLGVATVASGSVWPAVVAHVVNNTLAALAPGAIVDSTLGHAVALGLGLAVSLPIAAHFLRRALAVPTPRW